MTTPVGRSAVPAPPTDPWSALSSFVLLARHAGTTPRRSLRVSPDAQPLQQRLPRRVLLWLAGTVRLRDIPVYDTLIYQGRRCWSGHPAIPPWRLFRPYSRLSPVVVRGRDPA